MYHIVYTKRALKALRKVPRPIADRIRKQLSEIAVDPYAHYANVTKLQGRPGFRLRVGDWRVIYEIENDELRIIVLRIGSRGEIYR